MKIFIIHSGADKKIAEDTKETIKNKTGSDVLILGGKNNNWKLEARMMIKRADVVDSDKIEQIAPGETRAYTI